MRIKLITIFQLIVILCSCVSNNENKDIEYFKRDNLKYNDPMVYEFIIKIEKDSFIIAEYKDPFTATIRKGNIIDDKNKRILSATKTQSISLNTGQAIMLNSDKIFPTYQLYRINNSEYHLNRFENGSIDSMFKNKPFIITSDIDELGTWLFSINPKTTNSYIPKPHKLKSNSYRMDTTQMESRLRNEIIDLNAERENKLKQFVSTISNSCKVNKSDSIIINVVVNLSGEIKSHKLVNYSKAGFSKKECIDTEIIKNSINLGKIKTIPNTANRRIPNSISYNLPMK